MAKEVALNDNFTALLMMLFAASVGYNIYQNSEYENLFAEHVDLSWSARNDAADLVYIRNQLASCSDSVQ